MNFVFDQTLQLNNTSDSFSEISIKWNHFGILRRFEIDEKDWKFSSLLTKIRHIEPLFSNQLCYAGIFLKIYKIVYIRLSQKFCTKKFSLSTKLLLNLSKLRR